MSAMFLAMVWHARRRQEALHAVQQRGRGARVAARASGALPPRRLARAPNTCDHRPRPPGGVPPACGRAPARDRGRPRRAPEDRSDPRAAAAPGQGRPTRLPGAWRGRRRALPRGRLHALVRGRPSRLAARRACRRDVCVPTPRRFASRSTLCSRTPSSTPGRPDAIQLSAEARGSELVIEVADEGCGVPAEALGRIFRPLRARGCGADPHQGRRRSRSRDRRRDRQGARRSLCGQNVDRGVSLFVASAGLQGREGAACGACGHVRSAARRLINSPGAGPHGRSATSRELKRWSLPPRLAGRRGHRLRRPAPGLVLRWIESRS